MVTPFPQMVNTWVCDTIPVNGMWTSPSRWHLTQFQWMVCDLILRTECEPVPGDAVGASPSGWCMSWVSGKAPRKDDLFQASRRANSSLSLWILSNLDVIIIAGIAVAIVLCPADVAIKHRRAEPWETQRSQKLVYCAWGPLHFLGKTKTQQTNKMFLKAMV